MNETQYQGEDQYQGETLQQATVGRNGNGTRGDGSHKGPATLPAGARVCKPADVYPPETGVGAGRAGTAAETDTAIETDTGDGAAPAGSVAQGAPKGRKTLAPMPIVSKASAKPASLKQIEANRRNAAKSTGPRTEGGKAAVRLNAVRHGLLSPQMLLPGEDEEALAELAGRVREGLRPEGEMEELLVERITAALWRLRRLLGVEAHLFTGSAPEGGSARAGVAFRRIADTFSKLSRYEVAIENGMYRALHDLQRLQAARSAGAVLPPPLLEMDLTLHTPAA